MLAANDKLEVSEERNEFDRKAIVKRSESPIDGILKGATLAGNTKTMEEVIKNL